MSYQERTNAVLISILVVAIITSIALTAQFFNGKSYTDAEMDACISKQVELGAVESIGRKLCEQWLPQMKSRIGN